MAVFVALLVALAIDPEAAIRNPETPSSTLVMQSEAATQLPAPARETSSGEIAPSDDNQEPALESELEDTTPPPRPPAETADAETEASEASEASENFEAQGTEGQVRGPWRLASPHSSVRLGAGVDIGATPAATTVLELAYGYHRSRFYLNAGMTLAMPRRYESGDVALRAALGSLRVAAGVAGRRRALVLAIGAFVEGGVVGARGVDVPGPVTGHAPWFALGAEAAIGVQVGAFCLRARPVLALPLNRPSFVIVGEGEAYRPNPVRLNVFFDVELHFE